MKRWWRCVWRPLADRLAAGPARRLRVGPRAAGWGIWALHLSGPALLLLILLTLLHPGSAPSVDAPPLDAPTAAVQQPAPVRTIVGACDDPAISGCDSYSACVTAVTMFSGLAPNPRQALAEGIEGCTVGAD
jgi:hypothetical protein